MFTVDCYNCGLTYYSSYTIENVFDLVKCNKCWLLYVNPRMNNNEISETTRHRTNKGKNLLDVNGSFINEKVDKYLEIISPFFKQEDLSTKICYELGCDHGEFLFALKKYFDSKIILKGFEPNEKKAHTAKMKGLDIVFKIKKKYLRFTKLYSHLDLYLLATKLK